MAVRELLGAQFTAMNRMELGLLQIAYSFMMVMRASRNSNRLDRHMRVAIKPSWKVLRV